MLLRTILTNLMDDDPPPDVRATTGSVVESTSAGDQTTMKVGETTVGVDLTTMDVGETTVVESTVDVETTESVTDYDTTTTDRSSSSGVSMNDAVTLKLCPSYPCDAGGVDMEFAWSSSLVLEARVLSETLANAVDEYRFEAKTDRPDEPNSFVIGIFDGVAGGFVITIFAAKAMRRKTAVLVRREVFVQHGQLARPSVLSSSASEAILRGWLSVKEVVQLGYLHIASGKPIYWAVFPLEPR